MWVIPLIRHLGFVSLRNVSFTCPSLPHATAVKVLQCADRLLHTVAHSSQSQCLWKFGKEKHTDDWCGSKLTWGCDPAWTLTPVVFSPPICPSDCRGARPTGWHQSQQMVPVQSCCSQCPWDPRLHCTQQTLPLLQRSVCVCTYARVCGLKFLFDTHCPPFVMVKTLEQVEHLRKSCKTWFDFLSDLTNQVYVVKLSSSLTQRKGVFCLSFKKINQFLFTPTLHLATLLRTKQYF